MWHSMHSTLTQAACCHTVQEGLEARGFSVERLDTYNTVPVQSLPAADLAAAKGASVVAFASPSAIKAWLTCAGGHDAADMAIACIGAGPKQVSGVHAGGTDGSCVCTLEDLLVRMAHYNKRYFAVQGALRRRQRSGWA